MVIQAEQDRVKHLLSEALPMLCKSGLSFSSEFCIEALIGITLDKNDVFLVSIKETIKSDSGNEDSLEKTTDISITRVDDDTENLLTPRSHRKRRHSKSSRISDSESDNEVDEVTIKREKLSSMEQEDGSENSFETSTSSQRNYTTTGTQGTASVFVKQEPNMTDSINVEQAVENFNITGFTQDEGESNLGNQAIVKPVQSFSHDQAVSGLGRSAGMPPEIHAAEDTGQESDSINTTSATEAGPRNLSTRHLSRDFPVYSLPDQAKVSLLSSETSAVENTTMPLGAGDRSDIPETNAPFNTHRKVQWTMRLYTQWATLANTDMTPLLLMTEDEMDLALSKFIVEVRKSDGSRYSYTSISGILNGIQRGLEFQGVKMRLNRLPKVMKALDKVSEKSDHTIKKSSPISMQQEDELWRRGILGLSRPAALLRALYFGLGISFGLRGKNLHRNLRPEDFTIRNDNGRRYLEYENNKTSSIVYEDIGNPRCIVKIFEKYLSRCFPIAFLDGLYLKPKEDKCYVENIWYQNHAVGVNTLGKLVKNCMKAVNAEGNFTSQSLRATFAARVAQNKIQNTIVLTPYAFQNRTYVSSENAADKKHEETRDLLKNSLSPEYLPLVAVEFDPKDDYDKERLSDIVEEKPPTLYSVESYGESGNA